MRLPASSRAQGVTFVELFFDLAFVFAVTNTAGMFHHGYGWGTIGQATIAFWLVWWAWSQFTWMLNAADTNHPVVVAATLAATAAAFFMAVALPDAFHGRAAWFAVPYAAIRAIGLTLHAGVAAPPPSRLRTHGAFTLLSVGGLLAVVAGAVAGGDGQAWLWGAAMVLDVAALVAAVQSEAWAIRPAHFCERHGLFVIIALGETLIVAAIGIDVLTETVNILGVGLLIVATSCGMWWLYFSRLKPIMDRAMVTASEVHRSALARDAYSLIHFILLGGVIAFAIAIEHAFAHPSAPLGPEIRTAAAFSVGLFGGGTVAAFWRATGRLLVARLVFTLVTLGALAIESIEPFAALVVAFTAIVATGVIEHRTLAAESESVA